MNIVILAAGKGQRIFKKIKKNKCLLSINNQTLIERAIHQGFKAKIKNTIIVLGFKSTLIKKRLTKYKNIKYIFNAKYQSKEMLHSLMLALKKYNSELLFVYSDIIFSYKTINKIIKNSKKNITIPVLTNWKKVWKIRNKNPYDDAETLFTNKLMQLKSIGKRIHNLNKVKYQFMGMVYIPKKQRRKLINYYNRIGVKNHLHLTTFLNKLVQNDFIVDCKKVNDAWYEFDDYEDYKNYKKYYN